MPQPIHVSCQCGQFQAQLQPARMPLLALCYCADCQRYAHYFAAPEQLLDGQNFDFQSGARQMGAAVMIIQPPQLRISQGAAQLRCLQQRAKGAWRWYAACCNTPILNMAAHPHTHHLALLLTALEPRAREAYRTQIKLNVREQATVKASLLQQLQKRWAFFSFALRYSLGMLYAKLTQAHRHNPLIDPISFAPISPVQLLDAVTYAQLEAKRQANQPE